jgi:O-antigen/teichoic acid export membrane protein
VLFGFPASLYYFMPRASRAEQFGYVAQTAWFPAAIAAACCAAVLGVSIAWPGLDFLRLLPRPLAAFFAFVVLIAATTLMDYLPAARGDVTAQAGFNLAAALLRAGCTVAGALFGSIESVCWALFGYACGRLALQAAYVVRRMPLQAAPFDAGRFKAQFAYAAPFGIASAFWALRGQAEQWVGAAMLAPREYASLSIAGAFVPIAMLLSRATTASSVSAINRLEVEGDIAGMVRINAAANALTASYMLPMLTFFFVTSTPLITLVYTSAYSDAAMVTKLVCVGLAGAAIEVSTLTKALSMRRAVLVFDCAMLVVSLAMSVIGGLAFGMVGIVIGSVASRYVSTTYYVRVLVRRTGVPLAEYQHWGEMARLVLACCAAGAAGWGALSAARSLPLVAQIAVATFAMALVYLPLATGLGLPLLGLGRGARR